MTNLITTGLEKEIEQALSEMTENERDLLNAWCMKHGIDERSAVVRLAKKNIEKRLLQVFGDLVRLHS